MEIEFFLGFIGSGEFGVEATEFLSFFSTGSVISPGATQPGLVCGEEDFTHPFSYYRFISKRRLNSNANTIKVWR